MNFPAKLFVKLGPYNEYDAHTVWDDAKAGDVVAIYRLEYVGTVKTEINKSLVDSKGNVYDTTKKHE